MFFYAYLTWRVLSNNPKAKLNRLVALLLANFTLWAFYSTFSYALTDYKTAEAMYLSFSFLWHIAPGIALHIALTVRGLDKKLPRFLEIPALYLPGLITTFTYNLYVYTGLEENRWYLMSTLNSASPWFMIYNIYLLLYVGATVFLLLYRVRREELPRVRKQRIILAWSMFVSLFLGLFTNAIFPALGIEFPFVTIYWNALWATGLWIALSRYGFTRLSPRLAVEQILRHINEVLIILDQSGRIFTTSDYFASLLGQKQKMIRGASLSGFVNDPAYFDQSRQLLAERGGIVQNNINLSIPGEGDVPYSVSLSEIRNGDELQGYLFSGHDIRHWIKLGEAQRMKSIGTMTGGLAHNFNNILAGIYGASSLLRIELKKKRTDKSELEEKIEMIEQSSKRGREIVRQLLSIAGEKERYRSCIDLVPIVDTIAGICEHSFDKRVVITIEKPEAAMIIGDTSGMEQLLLNLTINALHAMTIMKSSEEEWGGVLTISLTPGDGGWLLQVRDTGVGMDKETLQRIFDPFFTTKEEGHGSGLGLPMVQRFVTDYGGDLSVASVPNEGTAVSLFFPSPPQEMLKLQDVDRSSVLSSAQQDDKLTKPGMEVRQPFCLEEEEEILEQDPKKVKNERTLLVVDDEELVRKTIRRILQHYGYKALDAEEGKEALRIFLSEKSSIDGVILDLTMPGISGMEVLTRLRSIDKGIPVLLVSGGNMGKLDYPSLPKPFTPDELIEAVEGLWDC